MNADLLAAVIESPTEDNIVALLDDDETVFWVDWREEDDAIVDYCEEILHTGQLATETIDSDNEAGFDFFISYKGNRVRVPLVIGPEDRHITIVALNEILQPDYEIRFCIDSHGSDTLGFIPLACDTWNELESRYGDALSKRFYRIQKSPNLFTESLS